MMASESSNVHDPMYNCDTYFSDRLYRLHLHGDLNLPGSVQKRKSRAERCGARYKTQPVTFDEIKEVDEEPFITQGGEMMEITPEHLKDQLQTLSRSMDGLLPRGVCAEQHKQTQESTCQSQSGSKKSQSSPLVNLTRLHHQQRSSSSEGKSTPQQKLQDAVMSPESGALSSNDEMFTRLQVSTLDTAGFNTSGTVIPLVPSPNVGLRRQKVTAKAKKRQKALDEADSL